MVFSQSVYSLILLCLFGVSYLGKLLLMRTKNKINANVLGNRDKRGKIHKIEMSVKATSFMWVAVWLFESLYGSELERVLRSFYINDVTANIGLMIIFLGVIFGLSKCNCFDSCYFKFYILSFVNTSRGKASC